MTLKQLAAMANVSVSTASRALNDSCEIAPETREHVLKCAAEHGYFGARKQFWLNNSRASQVTVALILPEASSADYNQMASILIKELRQLGAHCVTYYFDYDLEYLDLIYSRILNDPSVNAIICFDSVTKSMQNVKMPIVVTMSSPALSFLDLGGSANGINLAIEYLVSKGYKDIALACDNRTPNKVYTFSQTMSSITPSPQIYMSELRDMEAGAVAANKLLASDYMPAAVVCTYDEIAYGFIFSLNKAGVRVPEDISVIGLNDIPASKHVFGGLTSVKRDCEDTFKEVAAHLVSSVNNRFFKPAEFKATLKVIERGTVK